MMTQRVSATVDLEAPPRNKDIDTANIKAEFPDLNIPNTPLILCCEIVNGMNRSLCYSTGAPAASALRALSRTMSKAVAAA